MKLNKRRIIVIIIAAVIILFAVITLAGSLRNHPANPSAQVLEVNLTGKTPDIDTISERVVNSGNSVSHPILL